MIIRRERSLPGVLVLMVLLAACSTTTEPGPEPPDPVDPSPPTPQPSFVLEGYWVLPVMS
jgi:hypothetical protein